MAGKITDMSKVKQLLRMHLQSKGKKTIARELKLSKNTVKKYLEKVTTAKLDVSSLLELADPELEKQLFAGNPSYKDLRYEELKPDLTYYAGELSKTGVTRLLLWEEYRQKSPEGYQRSQFFFHLHQYLKAKKSSLVLSHEPADKLYVDFAGKKLPVIDPETGEITEHQVFVACLPYSDYGFAMAVPTQCTEDFLHAMEACFLHLGGVPRTIVPDNLKSAVIKANNYEPDINKALMDFANHYQTTVTPTRPYKPQDKALVENQVKLVYNRVYAQIRNRQFFSLTDLNEAITYYMLRHNQTRMQKKPYCRQEQFLGKEKHLLSSLPEEKFHLKYYREAKVSQNNHVYLGQDQCFYSVPYIHIGAKSRMIYTRHVVDIYVDREKVASHRRSTTSNYVTLREHLCSHHQHYLNRSPAYYTKLAKGEPELQRFFEILFSQDIYPEQLYKRCDGLLSLQRKTVPEGFRKALQMGIEAEQYSYQFIKNIIENKTYLEEGEKLEKTQPLPQHANTRGRTYYQ